MADIVLAYLYGVPNALFLVLREAVLFARVLTIGGFTRHSEITAAKASGISFLRFIAPIAVGALAATGFGLLLAEVVPPLNARRLELLQEKVFKNTDKRANFAYLSETGRVYKVGFADVTTSRLEGVEIERPGAGPDYPSYVIAAKSGTWDGKGNWLLADGVMHILPDSMSNVTVSLCTLRASRFTAAPTNLVANPKTPAEMVYRAPGRIIHAMERDSGLVGTSLALMNLLLAAHDVGLGASAMTGPLLAEPALREILAVPESWGIVALVPMGLADESPRATDRKAARKVTRWLR